MLDVARMKNYRQASHEKSRLHSLWNEAGIYHYVIKIRAHYAQPLFLS